MVKVQAQDAVVVSMRTEPGPRRSPVAAKPTAVPEKNPDRDNLRMLVVALLLMLAIAVRRNRSDPR
ncbi:MAG: hypothetical protein LH479_04940 [Polaromonas sp.]|nr:hypothetical protein [Polaromonas sp.]